MRKATGQTRIHHQELFHLVLIAGSYHDKLATIVLHAFHQRVDSFLAILVTTITERIGFINEQDAAHRLVTHIINNLRGFTHVLSDQSGTTGLNDAGCGKDLHSLKYLTHLTCNRGLTCSWITCQDKVHSHLLHLAGSHRCTLLHEHTLYGQTTDGILNGTHADKFIQFIKHLFERTG